MNKLWIFLLAVVFGGFQTFPSVVIAEEGSDIQQAVQKEEETIKKLLEEKFERSSFLARLYEKDNNLEKAVEYYAIASSVKEQDLETNRKLADLNYRLHRYERALSAYEVVLKLDSGSKTSTYQRIGDCYKNLNNIDKAKETWREILKAAPDNEYSYTQLGTIYKDNKMYDESVEIYKKAIELFPKSYQLHTSLAEVYSCQSEYEPAAAECEKALDNADPNERRWIADKLMEYYQKADMIDKVIEDKESELKKLDKDLKDSCLRMAVSYEKNKEYQKAIKMYERVLLLYITEKDTGTINGKIKILKQKVERE